MSLAESKDAIIESLSTMDRIQAQQVLMYIQDVRRQQTEKETSGYQHFKAVAMAEIRHALREIR